MEKMIELIVEFIRNNQILSFALWGCLFILWGVCFYQNIKNKKRLSCLDKIIYMAHITIFGMTHMFIVHHVTLTFSKGFFDWHLIALSGSIFITILTIIIIAFGNKKEEGE